VAIVTSTVVILLFALVPLASAVQVPHNESYTSPPTSCQPGVQNEYPANATAGQKIVIVTTVTNGCVGPDVTISQVIVNILLPNSSEILSTAIASPAINTVTARGTSGPWNLIVQIFWNGYPASGNYEMFETTITIKIIGSGSNSHV